MVEYFDQDAYTGKVGPFRKSHRFAWQQAFRIALGPGIHPFRDLFIGDISDIATPVLATEEFRDKINFSLAAAKEFAESGEI